jgi:hypothetical protein
MKRVMLSILMMVSASIAYAGDAENIQACVKKANEFAGVPLNEFDASYEGNIFSQSVVKWKNAYCEVKLSEVYNLQVEGKHVVFNGYAGKESYALKKTLDDKTDAAINQLKARIAILEQRMSQTSAGLKKPKPDHTGLTRFIEEGIEKSVGAQREATGGTSSKSQDTSKASVAPTEVR